MLKTRGISIRFGSRGKVTNFRRTCAKISVEKISRERRLDGEQGRTRPGRLRIYRQPNFITLRSNFTVVSDSGLAISRFPGTDVKFLY